MTSIQILKQFFTKTVFLIFQRNWLLLFLGLFIIGITAFTSPFLDKKHNNFLDFSKIENSFAQNKAVQNYFPASLLSPLSKAEIYRLMCLPDDSLALVELYNATDGANWTNPWVLTDPWTTWNGVVLNASDSCVLELNLSNQNIIGQIPASMFGGEKLNQIQKIDLSNNELTDAIPTDLGTLLTLEEINLGNNNLTGEIPASLSDLLLLQRLDLSFNSLTGDFPVSLTDISILLALESINIDSNFIENVPTFPVNRPITLNFSNNKLKLNSLVPNNKSQYTFTYSPQDSVGDFKIINVPQGGTFKDTVSVNQINGTTTYRWLRAGTLINSQTDDSVLVVDNANVADHEGIYTAEVTHTGASDITLHRKVFLVNIVECPSNNILITSDTTVCEGTNLPTIEGTEAELGEVPFFSYQWQQALDGDTTNWTDASNGNVPDYALNNAGITIADTAYFRRIVIPASGAGCDNDTSSKVAVIILPNITENTLYPSIQNVCLGTIPTDIYGSTSDSSVTSPLHYRYQVSLDSGMTWIDSLQTQNFAFTDTLATADTVQFRRIVTGACAPDTSNTITINSLPRVVADSIFESQTICINTQPDTITGSIPTGGDREYKYLWQIATRLDTADWLSVDSTRNLFVPPVANDTFYVRRVVQSACFADTSNIVDIFISPDLGNDTSAISISQTQICVGNPIPTINGTAPIAPTGFRYLWEVSLDSALWTSVDSVQNYTPVDSTLFDSVFMQIPDSFLVRRLVIDSCRSYPSNVVKLFMIKPIDSISNLISYDSTGLCEGDTTWQINATQPTGGSGSYNYQWQISFDSISWAARGDSLLIEDFVLTDTTYFRRLVIDSCRTDTSNVVFIPVAKPFGINQLTNPVREVCVGDSTKITIIGTNPENEGSFSYIYEQSPDTVAWFSSSTFTFSSGTLTQTQRYVPDTLFSGQNYFRRIVLGGCRPDTSNVIDVTVILNARNNFLFGGETICQGDSASLITATDPIAGEAGNIEISWQISTDSTAWIPVETDTITAYDIGAPQQTTYVRRSVKSGTCPPSFSNVLTIKVIRFIENNEISSLQTVVCEGSAADTLRGTFPTEGGNDSTAYRFFWQSRRANDSTAIWRTVGGDQDYFTGPVNFDTQYRRLVSVACFSDTSNIISLEINPTIKNNVIDEGYIDCSLDTLGRLNGTVLLDTLNEIGQFRYQWQNSRNQRDWADIANTNTASYQPTPIDTTTFYRRLVINECFTDSSNIAEITIRPTPILEIIQDSTINIGYDIQLFANGGINYVWTPSETLTGDSTATPTANPTISTMYTVRAENIYGCVTYDSVFVTVIGTPKVRTVDVITPDGNGLNDQLYIEEIERYPDNELVIINRWGQEVFRKKGYLNDWEGTNKTGGVLPAGTYFYIIKFETVKTILKGSFEIIR
ncbi:Leucine Rich Repeat (LRR)-containing protein [Bernardetia litoralis DSM 6794]|uniref:Leucine Rich Repeat (LRR)-containing protein n=1 Tax=Bernardetia litoralis (strain ATCC 23117 / DSM 6794 / NBRC 15988 / NCIMB 1366 / Fx l1 / Sio-4) TaxID=880071 RepID=I4AME6_BERLS|nr:gliding motility-associated C-terminal domain-containing protein [Bernardetia litoralis]AFM05131.1 Leucine Rich Repeat (LRR)-containing protein [Bernardetia litoralis DSM 6794]